MVGDEDMFRNIEQSDLTFVEVMLARINRSARNLFQKAYQDGFLRKAYVYEEGQCQGVFTMIEGESYYSVQLSFQSDLTNGAALTFLEDEIKKMIQTKGEKELYVNVNGYNVILIHTLLQQGFHRDSYGFEFSISNSMELIAKYMECNLSNELEVKGYEEEHCLLYLKLLDDAFRNQNIVCNEEQDTYTKYQEDVVKDLFQSNEFYAFWDSKRLVGICILNGDYLDTIAVEPEFQTRGYGSKLMDFCIRKRFSEDHGKELYLYTYYQNKKAQRFYLKHGFYVQGFYYETTYIG